MPTRIAFMPVATYPEPAADRTILAAAGFAAGLGYALHVRAYSVEIPQMRSPLGKLFLDVPGLVRTAEERSKAGCTHLQGLLAGAGEQYAGMQFSTRQVVLGGERDAAAAEARYYDLTVLPWSDETALPQEMAEAVVFGSGRPAILVPPSAHPVHLDHIAIAWDASHVAARALGDALSLMPNGGRVSVLTVRDEKPLNGPDIASALASSLEKRGFTANAFNVGLGDKTIGEALQDKAVAEGAQFLAMGGFGHSRLRDFVLGGATKGVLAAPSLPALFSH